MSDNDVEVHFGASTEEVESGAKRVKESMDSVKESVDSVAEAGKKLAEVLGVAFTLEALKSYVESMASLGLATERTMVMLGASAEQVGLLGGLAKLTGTSMEGLTTAFERMSLNIQKSTRDAFNPAAQGLKVLGLNAKDLIGQPIDVYFAKLNEAVSKFAPSLNLTNALMAVGGRGIAAMLPLLHLNAEAFAEMSAMIKKAQDGLAAAVPGMAETHERLSIMELAAQSFGARIFSVLKPAIDTAATAITKWLETMDQGKVKAMVNTIADFVLDALGVVGNFIITIEQMISGLTGKLDSLKSKATAAAGGALGGATGGAIFGGPIGAGLGFLGGGLAGWFFGGDGDKQVGAGTAAFDKRRADFEAMIARWRESFKSATDVFGGEAKGGGLNAGAMDNNARQQTAAVAEGIAAQITVLRDGLEQKKAIFGMEADAFKITQGQKYLAIETAVQQEYAAEMKLLDQKAALYRDDAAKFAAVQKEKAALTARYAKEELKAVADSIKEQTKTWEGYLTTITGAFNSQLRGLLSGTVTWAQATKNILADLTVAGIEEVEKWVVKRAAAMLADATTAKTAAAADLVTKATAATAEVTVDAGVAFAGVFANLAPLMGPAAAGPAAEAEAAVFAGGLPKLDVGAWNIPGTMPALLHPGEMVIPQNFADGVRNGGGLGGGGGTQVTIHAVDSNSIVNLLKNNTGIIGQIVEKYGKKNPGAFGRMARA